ncbi:hypothetical protein GIB67_011958 [Kingdonia uniflora]|uniref:Uncharacterized protein n=1 Tax=Kingdonia uniflora TaxID=39325 RepID=A0A7J7LZY8_9MAGN|nr:hypothetical protein GIB67_011958 [Kingdonia uniflora]
MVSKRPVGRPPSLDTRVDRIKGSIDEMKDGMSKMQEMFRAFIVAQNKMSNTTREAATSAKNSEVIDEQQSKEPVYDDDKEHFKPLAEDLFFNHSHEDTHYVLPPRHPQTTTHWDKVVKMGRTNNLGEGTLITGLIEKEAETMTTLWRQS